MACIGEWLACKKTCAGVPQNAEQSGGASQRVERVLCARPPEREKRGAGVRVRENPADGEAIGGVFFYIYFDLECSVLAPTYSPLASTIGSAELNCRVRNVTGCDLHG